MTDQSVPPRFENAPGLVVRARRDGSWVAFWQARTDIVKQGFRPTYVPLWRGLKPSRADQVYVADRCQRIQNEMLTYAHGGVQQIATFDGTIRSLIDCYRSDTDSSYFKIRYRTRENYDSLCRRILTDLGDKAIREIDARTLLRSHERWIEDGHIAMAHSLMGMMRTLATFGATLLKSRDCRELKVTLADMRFTMPKPRTERLTAEHAAAFCAKAHEAKLPELALAQAIQFEAMLRQKDVIGEWVPQAEPGLSDVTYAGQKWLRGIRWNQIDANLILRHTTSKRGKDVDEEGVGRDLPDPRRRRAACRGTGQLLPRRNNRNLRADWRDGCTGRGREDHSPRPVVMRSASARATKETAMTTDALSRPNPNYPDCELAPEDRPRCNCGAATEGKWVGIHAEQCASADGRRRKIAVWIEPHERSDAVRAFRDRLSPEQINKIFDADDTALIRLSWSRGQSAHVTVVEEG